MRPSLACVALVALVMLAAGSSCPGVSVPVCGNGVLEDGESEAACCADAGCAFGTCTDGACLEDWQAQCTSDGECAGAFVCSLEGGAPAYDCRACPCPGADACYEEVCVAAAIRDRERDADAVDDTLPMEEYARLFDELKLLDAIPLAEAVAITAARLQADSRTTLLLAGADPAIARADLDAVLDVVLAASGFLPSATLDLRARRDDVCTEVAAAGTGTLPDGLVVALTPTDAASTATCAYPGSFARCDIPLAEHCALRAGRLAASVVVLDQRVALADMDQAMLLRAGNGAPDVRDAFLSSALSLFDGTVSLFPLQEGFRSGDRFVGAFVDGDVVWIVLADPNVRPDKTRSFRVVWNDPPSQAYLLAHNIEPRDCTFEDGDLGLIVMTCASGGFSVRATVDTGNLTLVDVTFDP